MGRRAQLRLRHASRVVSSPKDVLCDPSPFLSLFLGQEAPAGRSKDREDGRSGGRGLNRAVCAFPAATRDRAKVLSCICS